MAKEKKDSQETVSYKNSLNLPRTDFPIRANAKVDDRAMIKRWEDEDIYTATFNAHKGNTQYILQIGRASCRERV